MSSLARNLPKSSGLSKHFSLRFKPNSSRITKSHSWRSLRNDDKESYLNVTNVSGRYVIADESTEPAERSFLDEARNTINRRSALTWARSKISKLRESVRKRRDDPVKGQENQYYDDSQEHDTSEGTYATTEDCRVKDSSGCDENVYSQEISPIESVSADNINQKSRLQRVVRWMTTKILQFRDRRSNAQRAQRSVYEKARAIFDTSDDSSMTSSNPGDPVYMDASLGNGDGQSSKIETEPARESMVYFELEPDQRYEVVTLNNSSKPVLAGAALKSSQYAKLGEHNKSERGNIYGDLSSAPIDGLKK